jgi:hypothetical protein
LYHSKRLTYLNLACFKKHALPFLNRIALSGRFLSFAQKLHGFLVSNQTINDCTQLGIKFLVGTAQFLVTRMRGIAPDDGGNKLVAQVVPVPAAIWLLGSGLIGLLGLRKKPK